VTRIPRGGRPYPRRSAAENEPVLPVSNGQAGTLGHWSLSRFKNFSWLSNDQLEMLAKAMTVKRIPRHTLLKPVGLHVILSGAVRLSRIDTMRARILVAIYGPGEVFGRILESWLDGLSIDGD
jgi:hypothetical protein